MAGYKLVLLSEMMIQLGEDRTKAILTNFYCPYNKDVEDFLRVKAIEFSKQNLSVTHLIFTSYKEKMELVGYFTLANKHILLKKNCLSKTLRKKVCKFGTYNKEIKSYIISAPLIAQLGKNYNNGLNKLISGDELLKIACDKIALIQQNLGGKFVYLECEDKPKLIKFYGSNGFVAFGKRLLDKDEAKVLEGEYLIQMLKYIK